jgi:large subunit ribosomal protein L25
MGSVFALSAKKRTELGTGASRALRKSGMIPAVVYGAGKDNLSIAILEKEITRHYRKPCFISTVIELEVDKVKYKVLPKVVELHPTTDLVHHVDFVHLDSKFQTMEVPVIFEGKDRSVGVKRGGFFNVVKRTVALNCPINDLPQKVVVDVTGMYVGKSIKASDLVLPSGCSLVTKPSQVIASITGRSSKADLEDAATAEGAEK